MSLDMAQEMGRLSKGGGKVRTKDKKEEDDSSVFARAVPSGVWEFGGERSRSRRDGTTARPTLDKPFFFFGLFQDSP